jgi:UDP-N-acetylglucosamine--N-acetylmuramyl-(pentapeptide) pyrophosphoryl-undecaprenol N-acetylglucosamine transferase
MKKVLLTGGGTGGHVTPNLAIIEQLNTLGVELMYIGSYDGLENQLIPKTGVQYKAIYTGKWRRYFSFKNVIDIVKIGFGTLQSLYYVFTFKPDVIFSKGGFVSIPVVVAGFICRIPIIIHESDLTPGLANKIAAKMATIVCVNFEKTIRYFASHPRVEWTGSPIRPILLTGDKARGLKLTGFNTDKPIILVVGGSMGSKQLNEFIRHCLPSLLVQFQVIHLCGNHGIDTTFDCLGYVQYEYADETMSDLLAVSDVVISRSGANMLLELIALNKLHVLIPLSKKVSRGDQVENANYTVSLGISEQLDTDNLSESDLLEKIAMVLNTKPQRIRAMTIMKKEDGLERIVQLIQG